MFNYNLCFYYCLDIVFFFSFVFPLSLSKMVDYLVLVFVTITRIFVEIYVIFISRKMVTNEKKIS